VARSGTATQAITVAIALIATAGSTTGSDSVPSRTSTANRAPPRGTLYTAAIPAPAPQATSSRRCQAGSFAHSDRTLAAAAPVSWGAPSRPSDAPIPTITIDSTPRAWLRQNDRRPPPSHSASEISPAPEPRTRTIISPPIPAITPAASRTAT
jgi:hypothetical protein